MKEVFRAADHVHDGKPGHPAQGSIPAERPEHFDGIYPIPVWHHDRGGVVCGNVDVESGSGTVRPASGYVAATAGAWRYCGVSIGGEVRCWSWTITMESR